jgi:hypothetical protein
MSILTIILLVFIIVSLALVIFRATIDQRVLNVLILIILLLMLLNQANWLSGIK